ncbi:MAG: fluoride efflux transporter CrcB [Bauldia sp.]|nr:fluoride efflux transporter CrcB [Bauldia sp.]MCW5716455.1 fluoride efflux transporter CrcB [Bauldia sp.]
MGNILIVAAGGAIGSVSRYLVGSASLRLFGSGFPVGTMIVNVLGSFLMGVFIELLAQRFNASEQLRLLVATGLLGGFTTFSAFSLDVVALWERGETAAALAYAGISVVASLLALVGGLALVRTFA